MTHGVERTTRQIAKKLEERDLPVDFPAQPLGQIGTTFFYLSASGQVVRLPAKDHAANALVALVSPHDEVLDRGWPRYDKEGHPIDGFNHSRAARALMRACSKLGPWEAGERLRRAGCWRLSDGRLLVHCGDIMLVDGRPERRLMIDGLVCERSPAKPRPAAQIHGAEVGRELHDILVRWNWSQPELAPLLLLGWIGAAWLSGALAWRPMVWVTGGKGTGKSWLVERLMAGLFGPWILSTTDTTAAAIWQRLDASALPVAFDESESEEDNSRINAVIRLARHAASGGRVMRGGADHKGSSFEVRSAFLFGSIYVPALRAQDLSRMAILELLPLDPDRPPPLLKAAELGELGLKIFRRAVDLWPRLPDLLDLWADALRRRGMDPRGCDQWGTLLALGSGLMSDEPPPEVDIGTFADLVIDLARGRQVESQDEDPSACLLHLATTTVSSWHQGERQTIGAWIARAYQAERELQDGVPSFGAVDARTRQGQAERILAANGVRVMRHDGAWWVAVANGHAELQRHYSGTHWSGRSGATGVWRQALLRIEGARSYASPLSFPGYKGRCALVPIGFFLDNEASSFSQD